MRITQSEYESASQQTRLNLTFSFIISISICSEFNSSDLFHLISLLLNFHIPKKKKKNANELNGLSNHANTQRFRYLLFMQFLNEKRCI